MPLTRHVRGGYVTSTSSREFPSIRWLALLDAAATQNFESHPSTPTRPSGALLADARTLAAQDQRVAAPARPPHETELDSTRTKVMAATTPSPSCARPQGARCFARAFPELSAPRCTRACDAHCVRAWVLACVPRSTACSVLSRLWLGAATLFSYSTPATCRRP